MSKNRHLPGHLKQMQSLPLDAKIRMSKSRIKSWYDAWWRFEIFNEKTGKTRFSTIDNRDSMAEPKMRKHEYVISAEAGQAYVSFSGGKDSTVLADLCAQICKRYGYKLFLLFVNTGLEYPEIQKFVKEFAEWLRHTYEIEVQLDIVRPEMRFDEVLKQYGYPVVSKEVAQIVREARIGISRGDGSYKFRIEKLKGEYRDKNGELSEFNKKKWECLLDAPFDISEQCCTVMKKNPSKQYEKETGRKAIIGTMAAEGALRKQRWIRYGCNAFGDKKRPTSNPLSFWTEQDVLHYLQKYGVPYCSVYGDIRIKPHGDDENQIDLIDYLGCYTPDDALTTTGCKRTGCIFCMFGCHMEKGQNRFQRMKETHPRQYKYCINGGEMVDGKWQPNKEGLGLGKILDYIGVDYE